MMQKLTPRPLADIETKGAAFAQGIGAPTLAALRALPADKLARRPGQRQGHAVRRGDRRLFPDRTASGDIRQRQGGARAASGRLQLAGGPASAIFGDGAPTVANYRAGLTRTFGDKADALFALYPAETDADVLPAATALASDDFLALSTWKWFDLQRRDRRAHLLLLFARVRPRALAIHPP